MSLSLAVFLLWSVLGMSVRKVIVRFKSSDNIKDTLGKVSLVDYHSALLKLFTNQKTGQGTTVH